LLPDSDLARHSRFRSLRDPGMNGATGRIWNRSSAQSEFAARSAATSSAMKPRLNGLGGFK